MILYFWSEGNWHFWWWFFKITYCILEY